jgi:hypothetical protein
MPEDRLGRRQLIAYEMLSVSVVSWQARFSKDGILTAQHQNNIPLAWPVFRMLLNTQKSYLNPSHYLGLPRLTMQ